MKIYKYMTDDTFRDHLDSHLRGEVYLSLWREFNDPMEGYFSFFIKHHRMDIVDAVVSEKSEYRVSCFSNSDNKYLLWSYYTNKHSGVCLEYEVDKDQLPSNCILEKITYTAFMPKYDATRDINQQAQRFLLTKTAALKREGEIRLLCRNPHNDVIVIGTLTSIIFGMRCSHETKQQVETAIQIGHYNNPTLYLAEIKSDRIRISRRKLEHD